MLAVVPASLEVPSLAALTLVAFVSCALIAWDLIHYGEHRREIRQARR